MCGWKNFYLYREGQGHRHLTVFMWWFNDFLTISDADLGLFNNVIICFIMQSYRASSSLREFRQFLKELWPFFNQPSYNCATSGGISTLQTHLVFLISQFLFSAHWQQWFHHIITYITILSYCNTLRIDAVIHGAWF